MAAMGALAFAGVAVAGVAQATTPTAAPEGGLEKIVFAEPTTRATTPRPDSTTVEPPRPPRPGRPVNQPSMKAGFKMDIHQGLRSRNDVYTAAMLKNGDFALFYTKSRRLIWSTNTKGKGGVSLHMQKDGNLVMRKKDRTPIWETATDIAHGGETSVLTLENCGHLVLRQKGKEVWSAPKGECPGKPDQPDNKPVPAPSPGDGHDGDGIAAYTFAKKQLGNDYEEGSDGWDTWGNMGLVRTSWKEAGVTLSRKLLSWKKEAKVYRWEDRKPGDILMYRDVASKEIRVAMFSTNLNEIIESRVDKGSVLQFSYYPALKGSGVLRPQERK